MSAQPPVDTLIEMTDIKKVFLTDEVETHALADVTLTIDRGEYVSIGGPSGCGKSTLLSILGLLDTPSKGNTSSTRATSPICRRRSGRACAIAKSGSSSRAST